MVDPHKSTKGHCSAQSSQNQVSRWKRRTFHSFEWRWRVCWSAEKKTCILVRHNQMACCRQLRHTNGPLNDTPTLPTRGLILSERGLTLMPQNLIGLLEYLWFWKSLKTKNVPYQVLLHIINIAYQSVTATSVMESFPGLKVNYIHTYSIHRSSFRTEMYASSWSECCFMHNTVLGFWHSFVK